MSYIPTLVRSVQYVTWNSTAVSQNVTLGTTLVDYTRAVVIPADMYYSPASPGPADSAVAHLTSNTNLAVTFSHSSPSVASSMAAYVVEFY